MTGLPAIAKPLVLLEPLPRAMASLSPLAAERQVGLALFEIAGRDYVDTAEYS